MEYDVGKMMSRMHGLWWIFWLMTVVVIGVFVSSGWG